MNRSSTTLALVAAGALVLAVLWRRGAVEFSDQEGEAFGPDEGEDDMPNVFHRSRAAGVDRRLLEFLDWWEAFGPFPIMVGDRGGVRTDAEQAALFAQGRTVPGDIVTNASTASSTAHGHGGALDLYPVRPTSDGKRIAAVLDKELMLFEQIGHLAESHGLVWGGRFNTATLKADRPHVEVPNWRLLPIAQRVA